MRLNWPATAIGSNMGRHDSIDHKNDWTYTFHTLEIPGYNEFLFVCIR